MNRFDLHLTDNNWTYGSYRRRDYKKAMIYTFHQYKNFSVVYNMSSGRVSVSDGFVNEMHDAGLVTHDLKTDYENHILSMFTPLDGNDLPYIEELYEQIQKERIRVLGVPTIEQGQQCLKEKKCIFDTCGGIDQSRIKEELQNSCESVIMVLTQAELYFLMEEDIKLWTNRGKEVYLLVNKERGYDIPDFTLINRWIGEKKGLHYLIMEKEELNLGELYGPLSLKKQIENKKTCLFFYGSDGFLQCKNLNVPSVIHAIPTDYFSRSMTNQHGMLMGSIVYVPMHFDIVKWVPMTEKIRISYWQLARLWEKDGDVIYTYEPEQLYYKYPQYFLNIYANGSVCVEGQDGYPIQVKWTEEWDGHRIMEEFDKKRDEAISGYLNRFDQYEYHSTYFDENLNQIEIPWYEKEQQNGILVHAIRIKKAGKSYVNFCEEGENVRTFAKKTGEDNFGLSVYSNFLFFLTPKLAQFYNDLREDRPREQLPYEKGHLDYMLYEKEGKRIETFPLFRKACIGLMKNGQFLFFNFNLGGGKIQFEKDHQKVEVDWKKNAVNPRERIDNLDAVNKKAKEDKEYLNNYDVCVYTPTYAKAKSDADIKNYRVLVGEDRLNIVISQDKILCVRKGSVVLSSVGIVISLNNELGDEIIKKLHLEPLENGYYDCSKIDFTVKLERPEEVKEEDWKQVVWSYGGGLSLILNGVGLCDGDHMEQWLMEEGWMSPMSRQTQESAIHLMVKHPRTAIGITKDGDLVILVYSGRTKMSVGADYNEMCQIARKLYPDVWSMMNVDGGGSAMLGIAVGGSFMELSYPATSFESCAGMVRPINTILCLK